MDFLFNFQAWCRKPAAPPRTVLVAMAEAQGRRAARQAVARALSANVIEVDGRSGFHHAVTFREIDLIVADADIKGCRSFEIIEQIRYGRLHGHPFPVVILLCDRADSACRQRALDCGADLVLPAGLSARLLAEQVERLAQDRKPFLVAPHYIGPERRKAGRAEEDSTSHLVVPNPLARRDGGDEEYRRQLSLASHRLSLMRRGLYQLRLQTAAVAVSRGLI
jgi:DNA-binding NarL/FixJ family response regulator